MYPHRIIRSGLQPGRPLRRFASAGAWFFIVVSLGHLAWAMAALLGGGSMGLVTLYQTSVGDEVYRAWGLAYDGWPGLIQASLQGLFVMAAAALTVIPWSRGRRLGHGILLVWAGWWTMNLIRLAGIDGETSSILSAGTMTTLLGCTAVRAMCSRTTPGGRRDKPGVVEPATPTPAPAPAVPIFDDEESGSPGIMRSWLRGLRARVEWTILNVRSRMLNRWGRLMTALRGKVTPAAGKAGRKARNVALAAGQKAHAAGTHARRGCAAGLEKLADGSHRLARRVADSKTAA